MPPKGVSAALSLGQGLRVSPQWSGPPQPPEGAGPNCIVRGSLGGFQSDGRPACWCGAGGPGGTAAHWGPAAHKTFTYITMLNRQQDLFSAKL